jgi:type IV pilus assembly protein PilA
MRLPNSFKKRGFTLVELMIVVAIIGILAVLAIYGVRKYVANSKTAEARNSLGQIGKDSTTAFERESMAGTVLAAGVSTAVTRAECVKAGAPVPSAITGVQGKKYQSSQTAGADWSVDEATNAGFACLKFSMTAPQYYMYNYSSDAVAGTNPGTVFTATANGDLNGDTVQSTFTLVGSVITQNLFIAPNLVETDPEE